MVLGDVDYDLPPCPFCGKTSTLGVYSDIDMMGSDEYEQEDVVSDLSYCVNCDFNKGGCGATGGFRGSKVEAVAVWTTRLGTGK